MDKVKSDYWTSDSSSHVLIVDVQGFKMKDLMVELNKPRKLKVSGVRRQVSGNENGTFFREFDVPHDSDLNKVSARFDDGVLTIIFPRKVPEKKPEEQAQNEDEIYENEDQKPSYKEESKKIHDDDDKDDKKHEHGRELGEEKKTRERTYFIEEDYPDLYLDKKKEWEKIGRLKKNGLYGAEKEEEAKEREKNGKKRDALRHDLHKEEEKEKHERTEGYDNDQNAQKKEEKDMKDSSTALEPHKEEEKKNEKLQGDDREAEQYDDLQKKKHEQTERTLWIEGKGYSYDLHLEEKEGRMRTVNIEGVKERKRNVLIEGQEQVNDLQKEKKEEWETGGMREESEAKQGKEMGERKDWGDEVVTPMKNALKTISENKVAITLAMLTVSIGFYWSQKLLSARESESA